MDVQLARFALHIMEHEGIKPAELAEAFGVSVRTVRNHVQAVNRSLEGVASIDLARGRGYTVSVADEQALDAIFEQARKQRRASLPRRPRPASPISSTICSRAVITSPSTHWRASFMYPGRAYRTI